MQKINHIAKKSNLKVRVAWKNDQKLRNKLIRSSLGVPKCPGGQRCNMCRSDFKGDCTKKNLVYGMRCVLCEERGQEKNVCG